MPSWRAPGARVATSVGAPPAFRFPSPHRGTRSRAPRPPAARLATVFGEYIVARCSSTSRTTDPVLPRQLGHRRPRHSLPSDRNDLRFRKPQLLHNFSRNAGDSLLFPVSRAGSLRSPSGQSLCGKLSYNCNPTNDPNVPTSITGLSMRQVPLVSWRLLLNGLGLRKSQKVFAVGFAKCATTSLHALFLSLGLPSFHGIGWRSCNSFQLLRTFDCFSDGIPKDLEKLDRLFPGSKFVLQVRDLQSWVYSRLGHIERSKKRGNYRVLPDWDTTDYAVRSWILMRNRHHLFVQEYFADRPHDLLIVNFVSDPSAGTRVANFLGFPGTSIGP